MGTASRGSSHSSFALHAGGESVLTKTNSYSLLKILVTCSGLFTAAVVATPYFCFVFVLLGVAGNLLLYVMLGNADQNLPNRSWVDLGSHLY